MILTKDQYEAEKEAFLNKHTEAIKKMLLEEKKKYLEDELKGKNWKHFAKEYMGGVWLILIVAYFAYVKDIISIQALIGFALLEVFAFGFAYGKWQSDTKNARIEAWSNEAPSLVRDFIADRMRECVSNSKSHEEYLNVVQFYAVALYDIPRNISFVNAYKD